MNSKTDLSLKNINFHDSELPKNGVIVDSILYTLIEGKLYECTGCCFYDDKEYSPGPLCDFCNTIGHKYIFKKEGNISSITVNEIL